MPATSLTRIPYGRYGPITTSQLIRGVARSNRYGRAAEFAWRNRGTAKRAATTIGRGYRAYKRRKSSRVANAAPDAERRAVAHQVSSSTGSTPLPLPIATLNGVSIDFGQPPTNTTAANYNQRTGSLIELHGIKICRTFYNESLRSRSPVVVNWALVQSKHDRLDDSPGEFLEYLKSQFFRQHSGAETTTQDFADVDPLTSTWDMGINCNPMNSNKCHIIARRKKMLNFKNDNSETNHSWIWNLEHYFKFNRRLEFTDKDQALPNKPIYEVFWYSTATPEQFAPDEIEGVKTTDNNTIYFTNIQ